MNESLESLRLAAATENVMVLIFLTPGELSMGSIFVTANEF